MAGMIQRRNQFTFVRAEIIVGHRFSLNGIGEKNATRVGKNLRLPRGVANVVVLGKHPNVQRRIHHDRRLGT